MENALTFPSETTDTPKRHPANGKQVKTRTRPQLLTRAELDGRTNAAKIWDQLIIDIERDLGGHDQLSTIECGLIEGYVGARLIMMNLNSRLIRGEQIDFNQHATAVSEMVRVASRLGLSRRARDISPTLSDMLRGPPA